MMRLNHWREGLALTAALAALARLALWLAYPLTENNDSPGYLQLGRSLLNNGFENFLPMRTPVYPAFLAATGLGAWTYPAQLLLGLLTSLLFFFIAYRLTASPRFATLAALMHALNPGQLFFEATLLTESLTVFLLALSLAGLLILQQKPSVWLALALSLAAGLAGLSRPLFAFLPVLLAGYLLWQVPGGWVRRVGLALAASLPALLLFAAWMGYVEQKSKIYSFDMLGGYRLINHVGGYIEHVTYTDEEHLLLREIFLRYRAEREAQTGSQNNAIWAAVPEMESATRGNYYSVSRTLGVMAVEAIRQQPWLYLQTALKGWWNGWWAAVYYAPDQLRWPELQPVIRMLVLAWRGWMFLANLLFLAMSALLAASPVARSRFIRPFPLMLAGLVWAASVAQSLFDHGDNQRYLVPVQAFVLLLVLWWGYILLNVRIENPSVKILLKR